MRSLGLLTALLVTGTALAAQAQTLNEQMSRMQQGQPAQAPMQAPASQAPMQAPATMQAPADSMMAPPASMPAQPPMMQPAAGVDSVGNGAIPALPLQVMTNGNITYINGGIGDEELEQLKAQGNAYNLHVMLSA